MQEVPFAARNFSPSYDEQVAVYVIIIANQETMSRANFHKYKKLIFIALAAVVFTVGLLLIRAANNRGDAPYLYIKFDEGYGSTAHDEQGNVNGTITGATWANEEDCKTGKCLYFDGSGDYVSIPDFGLE